MVVDFGCGSGSVAVDFGWFYGGSWSWSGLLDFVFDFFSS